MNKNPFKREISDIDKSQVEKILNEFDLIKIDRSLPSIQELMKQISSDTCWEGERYQELVEIDNAIKVIITEIKLEESKIADRENKISNNAPQVSVAT